MSTKKVPSSTFVDSSRLKRRHKDKKKEVATLFQSAAQQTCEHEFWTKHSELATTVVGSSSGSTVQSTEALKLLEQHAADIVQSCRRVIKEATQTKSIHCLCAGTHGLRAVVSTTNLLHKVKQQEAVIKDLYHIIVTCEQVHDENTASTDDDNGAL